jgi:hypothetical protein
MTVTRQARCSDTRPLVGAMSTGTPSASPSAVSPLDRFRLDDQVTIVTGASSGSGRASNSPIPGMGELHELDGALLLLASSAGTFLTGQKPRRRRGLERSVTDPRVVAHQLLEHRPAWALTV